MSAHLEKLARRVQADPLFLAAPLARYAESQQFDDDALVGQLGCTREALTLLRLCRSPQPIPPHFWQDIERIAARFQIDANCLAEAVRLGQALLAAEADSGPASGFLLAARAEEPPPGDEP